MVPAPTANIGRLDQDVIYVPLMARRSGAEYTTRSAAVRPLNRGWERGALPCADPILRVRVAIGIRALIAVNEERRLLLRCCSRARPDGAHELDPPERPAEIERLL